MLQPCELLYPIRCFSCGALLGDKYEKFNALVKKGVNPEDALDRLGVKRYCCRRMILSQFSVLDKLLPYSEAVTELREREEKEEGIE